MQLIYVRKIVRAGLSAIIGLGAGIMLAGCAFAQNGERFGIDISGRISKPKLEYGVLIGDDKTVRVEGVNAGINYSASNGVPVPSEVEFIWQAVGEKETHLEKIKLRSRIPSDVLSKIGGTRPMHTLTIEFFVMDGVPKYRWRLREHLQEMNVPSKDVAKGGDW